MNNLCIAAGVMTAINAIETALRPTLEQTVRELYGDNAPSDVRMRAEVQAIQFQRDIFNAKRAESVSQTKK